MRGTRFRALVREDPTCHGAAEPGHCSCWACALEPASHNYWARVPQLLRPMCLEPVLGNKGGHRNEKAAHHNEACRNQRKARAHQRRPNTAENKTNKIKINKFIKRKEIIKKKKMWYIYTMEYYSAIKRNEIGSFVETWMDLETGIQSEVSQKVKKKYRILTHICGI